MPQLGEHFTFALIIKVGAAAFVVTSIGSIEITPSITRARLDRGLHRFCFELRFGLTLFFLFALKEIESGVKKGLVIKRDCTSSPVPPKNVQPPPRKNS